MKVIFLDIDGVLNWVGTEERHMGFIGLDPTRITQFNKITAAHPDAKIVISSTWRRTFIAGSYQDLAGLAELLHKTGLVGEVIGQTPMRFSYVPRGGEIRAWIETWEQENPNQQLNYVILDDDTEGMFGTRAIYKTEEPSGTYVYNEEITYDLRPRHVVTDFGGTEAPGYGEPAEEGGLQPRHAEAAIKILST